MAVVRLTTVSNFVASQARAWQDGVARRSIVFETRKRRSVSGGPLPFPGDAGRQDCAGDLPFTPSQDDRAFVMMKTIAALSAGFA
jgi:hypothetical protein